MSFSLNIRCEGPVDWRRLGVSLDPVEDGALELFLGVLPLELILEASEILNIKFLCPETYFVVV